MRDTTDRASIQVQREPLREIKATLVPGFSSHRA